MTSYIIIAALWLLFYAVLYLHSEQTHEPCFQDSVMVVACSALWPLTLLIQFAMVLLFIRDVRRWPQ